MFGHRDSLVGLQAPRWPAIGEQYWLNSHPWTTYPPGKVILVDFWTYSCVNCLRTLPSLKKWHQQYADKGLTIIGVHTPEFAFEKERTNIEHFLKQESITYPVVQDNDFLIWNAFTNHYWPRKILIDTTGKIRYDHIGEGAYNETEVAIRRLLSEINPAITAPAAAEITSPETGQVCYPTTAETYCGYQRGRFGNVEPIAMNTPHLYQAPSERTDGHIYLQGIWEVTAEYVRHAALTDILSDYLELPWHGLECNLVMKSTSGKRIAVVVQLDGQPIPMEMAGADIHYGEGESFIFVDEPRMYRLVNAKDFGRHVIHLTTRSDKLECYAFTFGGCI